MRISSLIAIILFIILVAPLAYSWWTWITTNGFATKSFKVRIITRLHLVYNPLKGVLIENLNLDLNVKPAWQPFIIGGETLSIISSPSLLLAFGEKEHIIDITISIYRVENGRRRFISSAYNEIKWKTPILVTDTTVKSITSQFILTPGVYVIKIKSMNAEIIVEDNNLHEVYYEFQLTEQGYWTEPKLLLSESIRREEIGREEELEEIYTPDQPEYTPPPEEKKQLPIGRVSFFAQILLGDENMISFDKKPIGYPIEGKLLVVWYIIEGDNVRRVEKSFDIPKRGKTIYLGDNVHLTSVPYLRFSVKIGSGEFSVILDNVKAKKLNGRKIYALVGSKGVKISIFVTLFNPLNAKSIPADKFSFEIEDEEGNIIARGSGTDGIAEARIPISLLPGIFTFKITYTGERIEYSRLKAIKRQLISDPTISYTISFTLGKSGLAISAYVEGFLFSGYVEAEVVIYDMNGREVARDKTKSGENPYVYIPLSPNKYRIEAYYSTSYYEDEVYVEENQVTWVNIKWTEVESPWLALLSLIYIPAIGIVNISMLIISMLIAMGLLVFYEKFLAG